ncbi:M13 family metallopeptidase [Taibaiella lutea]|uniref:M13 family metallopeptidase n=1 Tax=Taibaiella lutea TaxID=2608001 RepID=A0A5M6CD50_9BACT|nr:M13 family metallopeptidase [Taibaiella lutea]KAA5533108.1 M13 family metallopeptidase [Taibaiella lutea]
MRIANLLLSSVAVGTLGLAASCQSTGDGTAAKSDFKFIDRANMDTTVKATDNFFLYANGAWLNTAKIPGDRSRWGSFDELGERTLNDLHTLLEDAAKSNAAEGSKERMAGDFYKSGMDSVTIDKAGITPLKPVLDRISAITNTQQLMDEIAMENTQGVGGVFSFGVGPDDKNVTKEICQFGQGGLGLSTKDDYFAKDARSAQIREKYLLYIQQILQLMGQDEATAKANADKIFKLETAFASASLAPVEMRDPQKLYNKFDLATINKMTPGMDWKVLMDKLKASGQDTVLVGMPKFFVEFAKQLSATPIETWKLYLSYNFTSDMAPYLSKDFSDARFNFYSKELRGIEQQQPRWKRVNNIINNAIGEQLGQLYVDKHFKPEAKQRMLELVNNLQKAFSERINGLDWMSEATKQKGLAKLNTFIKKIGYPDKWKDYSTLKIVPNNYVQNVLNASAFEYNYMMNKLGKPVDKTEWGMTPQTVNAYYNPAFNEIVFPAAILQFPFFDFNADDAVNYGGIGAVIGHEMTHGFDDQGAQYDADGNLKDWWTPEDKTKFTERTQRVVHQFDAYTVLDSIHVNGSLTQGENIADLGGVTIAYTAFKKTKQGQSNELIDGFTPDQRFFLSWAQVWRGKAKPETSMELIKTDPHSPGIWRCNGPLSNFEPFYKAFGVKEGDKMWRADSVRAKIW